MQPSNSPFWLLYRMHCLAPFPFTLLGLMSALSKHARMFTNTNTTLSSSEPVLSTMELGEQETWVFCWFIKICTLCVTEFEIIFSQWRGVVVSLWKKWVLLICAGDQYHEKAIIPRIGKSYQALATTLSKKEQPTENNFVSISWPCIICPTPTFLTNRHIPELSKISTKMMFTNTDIYN